MGKSTAQKIVPFALALAAVGVATAARALLYYMVGSGLPFLTFFPAVVFAALYGGAGAGLLATVLSAFTASLWLDPVGTLRLSHPADVIGLILFLVTCLLIVSISSRARRAREIVDDAGIQAAKLAAIVSTSDDAIISKSLTGIIQSWNVAAERLFGYTAEEMIGQSILKIIPADRKGEEADILSRLRRGEQIDHYETIRQRKDGTLIDIAITTSPLRDNTGKIVGASKIARDISHRRIAETQLRAAKTIADRNLAQLRAVVGSMSEGLVFADSDGNLLEWNDAALKMHGFSSMDEGRRPLMDFKSQFLLKSLEGELVPLEHWPLSRALRGESFTNLELEVHRIDTGVDKTISYSGTAVRDENGKINLALLTLHDMTLERQMQEALRQSVIEQREVAQERESLLASERVARADAERASRLKDEFLATVSHELRTPLNAILGYAHLLKHGGGNSDELAEGLRVIERNARMQTQIIEDILDMSRIVSGKLRLDVQRTDLAHVIDAAVETVQPAADAKEIRLVKTVDPLAGPVHGDPSRLQQCVWNLLTNAIKFTPRGGRVQVIVSRVNSHIEIAVSDSGQGIAPDFLPFVFEKFRQADAGAARKHGGLGLGLSIVKSLVEAHGGRVRVQSVGEGQGSTFTIELPRAAVHGERRVDDEHPTSRSGRNVDEGARPSLTGITVLAVDDEADARALVSRFLEECGARVLSASSAQEALDILDNSRVDVILSDLGMPGIDGYELIRRIRARGPGKGSSIPAAALTAFARSEDRTRALRAGYQTHIAKPVEPMELVFAVASLAGKTGGGI